jgi:hypothetical protein
MRNSIILFLTCSILASGQTSQAESERRQAILDYQLTLKRANQLITAMTAMTKYISSLPDFQERLRKAATLTPADQLAQVEKDPTAMSILKQNGLTPREYLVGVPTLRMALMAARGMPTGRNITASPANVAFAKANLAELKPKMDKVDGLQ